MKSHWQKAFLAALENTGSVTAACKAAGITSPTAYRNKCSDPVFAKQWEEALEKSADELEDEARRRAKAGSDILLMFLLKGLRPQRWRESRASLAPSELNAMIEREFERLDAKRRQHQENPLVN